MIGLIKASAATQILSVSSDSKKVRAMHHKMIVIGGETIANKRFYVSSNVRKIVLRKSATSTALSKLNLTWGSDTAREE